MPHGKVDGRRTTVETKRQTEKNLNHPVATGLDWGVTMEMRAN